jgi:hypothetical protein
MIFCVLKILTIVEGRQQGIAKTEMWNLQGILITFELHVSGQAITIPVFF